MENNERHIIEKILCGATEKFAYFVEQYSNQTFSLIIGIVGNHEDAEELTQDTFLKAFNNLKRFNTDSRFSTWLYRIAYNTAISHMRKKASLALPIDEKLLTNINDRDVDIALDNESDERIEHLYSAIEKLQPEEKALLQLFYIEEKSIGEIAAIQNISESNARVKLHRTRKKLYYIIENEYGE